MEYRFSKRIENLKPSAIREIFKYASDPSVVSLSAGNPSPDAFASDKIAEICANLFANRQRTRCNTVLPRDIRPYGSICLAT